MTTSGCPRRCTSTGAPLLATCEHRLGNRVLASKIPIVFTSQNRPVVRLVVKGANLSSDLAGILFPQGVTERMKQVKGAEGQGHDEQGLRVGAVDAIEGFEAVVNEGH